MADKEQYMGDGSNVSSNVLSEQLRAQADVIASIGKAMDKILWVISDPDVGIVKRLGDNSKITADTVVSQTAQLAKQTANIEDVKAAKEDIKDLKDVNVKAVEAKRPMLAIGWKIVEYLLLTAVIGGIIWMASLLNR